MPVTTARTPLLLLLSAAAVLLGVLGMHAVSGGPHTAGGVGHAAPAHLAAQAPQHASALTAPLDAAAEAATGSELPGAASVAVGAMCLAVLLGAAVLLAPALRGRAPEIRTSWRGPSLGFGPGDATRAPPPDLRTRLCVLRT